MGNLLALSSAAHVGWIDIAVVVVYLIGIVGIGIWVGLTREKGSGGRSYFLADGTLSWPLIGLALFATNISTIHLIGFAQEGYENGLAYGNFEWMAVFTLIALSLFFAPLYFRSRVATLPDFLEKRYSRNARNWLAGISIFSAIVIHIGFTLYTGAVVLEGLFGFPILTSIFLIALLTGIYTAVGGLKAVVVTESLQTFVLILGSVCLTVIGYYHAGGWEGIKESVEPVRLTMFRSADDPSNLPWYSVLLGYPVIGLWYWCADQTIVQRVLGAKSEYHARMGPLFAGFLKILPVFIFVLPGIICLALVNQGKLSPVADTRNTFDFMIRELLPSGLTGVMAAALLAALMSTVSGALNSIATLFSYDVYKQLRPKTSGKKLIVIGRLATFSAMLLAIAWSPFVGRFPTLYQGINTIISYLAPPITVVFLFGVFWKRASSKAAMITLICGSAMGLLVFLLDWFRDYTSWDMPFLMASFYLFVACSLVMTVSSWQSPHSHTAESENLVWKSPWAALKANDEPGTRIYLWVGGLLFLTMLALYIVFA